MSRFGRISLLLLPASPLLSSQFLAFAVSRFGRRGASQFQNLARIYSLAAKVQQAPFGAHHNLVRSGGVVRHLPTMWPNKALHPTPNAALNWLVGTAFRVKIKFGRACAALGAGELSR